MVNFCRVVFSVLPFVALVSAEGPQPGDAIDNSAPLPQWWYDIKAEHAPREVRQCPFLTVVPEDGDSCPGVSKNDHYYCIFGTAEAPTWFCTCVEEIEGKGDYMFRCGTSLETMEDIVPNYTPPVLQTKPRASEKTALTQSNGYIVKEIDGPIPGDKIDWETAFPSWWYDIKNEHGPREVRKCPFLTEVPADGDSCPGVSEKGFYYCVFGSDTAATWYCTCDQTDFTFHCGPDFLSIDEIKNE